MKLKLPWYTPLIVACLLFVGGSLFSYLKFNNYFRQIPAILVPYEGSILFDEAGKHTIFYEYEVRKIDLGIIKSTSYNKHSNAADMLQIQMWNADNQEKVRLIRQSNTTYSSNGAVGESLFDFYIDTPGEYFVSATTKTGTSGIPIKLTITHGMFQDFLILGLISGASALAAIGLTLFTLLRREKRKN